MPNVNVQYLVAGTLLDGGFSMRMAHNEERLHSPEVVNMMNRISLVADPEIAHTRSARISLHRRTGSKTVEIDKAVQNVRGTPGNPMSFAEVRRKARI